MELPGLELLGGEAQFRGGHPGGGLVPGPVGRQTRRIGEHLQHLADPVAGEIAFVDHRDHQADAARLALVAQQSVADPLLRRVASSALRARGYSVSATTEEEAALTLARSFSPDVVMVDLELPSPEGGNLFDTMRALTDAYIVGIAPPDADAMRIRALRAGADDVVSVPVTPDELAARAKADTLTDLDGIGDSSAKVIQQAGLKLGN